MRWRKPRRKERKPKRAMASRKTIDTAVRAAYNALGLLDQGHPAEEFRRKKETYSKEFRDFLVAVDTRKNVSEHWAMEIMHLAKVVLGAGKRKT